MDANSSVVSSQPAALDESNRPQPEEFTDYDDRVATIANPEDPQNGPATSRTLMLECPLVFQDMSSANALCMTNGELKTIPWVRPMMFFVLPFPHFPLCLHVP